MRGRAGRRRQFLQWAVGLVVVYTLGGFLALPWLLKTLLLWQLPKQLGRPVALEKVRFNPYTLRLALDGFAIREPDGRSFMAWDEVALTVKPAALLFHTVSLGEVTISNASARVQANRDGTFNFSDILRRFPVPAAPKKEAGKPWLIRIGRFQMTGSRLIYKDQSRATPFGTVVGPIDVTLHDFSTSPDNRNPYGFTAVTEAGEKFSWRGVFFLAPIRSRGEFAIENIALKKYAPYYDDFVSLTLNTGALDLRAGYRVEFTDRLTTAQLTNLNVTVRSLQIAERHSTNVVISLPELALADTALDLAAQTLNVGTFTVRGLRLDVRRLEDGAVNLARLFAPPVATNAPATAPVTNPPPAWVVTVRNVAVTDFGMHVTGFVGEQTLAWNTLAMAGIAAHANPVSLAVDAVELREPDLQMLLTSFPTNAPAGPANPAPTTARAPLPPVRISSIILTNGIVGYTDRSLQPAAALTVTKLDVSINGLSSDANAIADLRVAGRVDNTAPLEVTGHINPLNIDAATAMQVAFTGLNLLPLGPYAGKYLGYGLRKGKVSLDLKYDINQRALKADNRVVIDQFSLGEASDSPQAVKLPVKLVVAILKDRNGQIQLDLPVAGRIDDPQFRYWGAVWHVLGTLFTKAFTAPFALLGSMFGGGGEELSYQEFAPGGAALLADQTGKLDTLITAMTERPALNLEITGSVDPVKDLDPLKHQKLARLLFDLRAKQAPGNTNALTTVEYAAFLREAYAAALPQVQQMQATTAPPVATTSFPSNIANLTVPGTKPVAATKPVSGSQARKAAAEVSVEEMERQYLELITLTTEDYRQLSTTRIASVVAYLKDKGQIDPDRLLVSTNPNLPVTKDGARVVFGLQ